MKIKPGAKPIWARYNSPMALPPFRTNEIFYEVVENWYHLILISNLNLNFRFINKHIYLKLK